VTYPMSLHLAHLLILNLKNPIWMACFLDK
jgi:hypothetical protein